MRRRQDTIKINKWTVNQQWPYRVAIRSDQVRGGGFVRVEAYCRERNVCKRTFHYFDTDARTERMVYCFADAAEAAAFAQEFQGTPLPPRTIPRWPSDALTAAE